MVQKADILIKNASWLVTVDPSRRIIKQGAIAIKGNKIAELGKSSLLTKKYQAQTVIDARDKLVMPGLIDGHAHNVQQLARGLADDVTLSQWLFERIYPYEAAMTEEEAYLSALCCQLEMIKAGSTCYIDPGSPFTDETARATEVSGMRGIITRSTCDVLTSAMGSMPKKRFQETTQQSLRRAEATVKKWDRAFGGRLKAWFSLRVLSICSDQLCLGITRLAKKYRVGVQSHAAGSPSSTFHSLDRYGARDVERLGKLGVLGPNWFLIHMGWVSPQELLLLKEKDVKVVHCPSASFHLASGRISHGRFPEMLEMGMAVCLGSDAAADGNYMDIVRVMSIAGGAYKDNRLDPKIMPPETVIEMATINGARAALWEKEIGSLEKGKKADIVLFDTTRPDWRPVHNPIANLVYCANGSSADTVIVDGKILMQGRKVLTLDEEKLLKQAQKAGERIAKAAKLTRLVQPRWPMV